LDKIPEQRVGFSGLYHWKARAAETVRITEHESGCRRWQELNQESPATTLITGPTPIGVTVWVRLRLPLTD